MQEINYQLDLTLIEDHVAWFENIEEQFSLDIPTLYNIDNRTFEITKECDCRWCYNEEQGYHFASMGNNKVLILFLEQTDEGFEIVYGKIFNIVTTH